MGIHYEKALTLGKREISRRRSHGESGYLPVLDDIAPNATALPAEPLHLVTIPLQRIVGTATRGRTTAFAANFMPALDLNSEFADKWENLYASVVAEGVNSPIKAYEYMNKFYVIEGNKRVSVMKYLGASTIEGEVTRLLPPMSDDSEVQIYYEFVRFYADTGLNNIYFSRRGGFAKLYEYTDTTPGEKWPDDLRQDVKSAFFHFSTAFKTLGGGSLDLTEGDAFLVYLRIYGFKHACEASGEALEEEVRRIWDEIVMSAQEERVVLLMEPKANDESGLLSLFRRPRRLKAAFLYNRPVEQSGWSYWHELGRQYVDTVMEGRVETSFLVAQTDDEAREALTRLAEDGTDVVFTTSPQFLSAAIRASVGHEDMKILNCSLQTPYHHIRSYYLRVYEAKFILGAIAGALTEDHRLGYIADYPIYGTPAGINAFAMGARLTDPRAQVFLEWSGLRDHDPEAALRRSGVSIICNRDVSAPARASREFGLYRVEGDGETQPLAMPVLNWGALYETILRSVLTGGWESDEDLAPRLAMAYWPGMPTGAVDVFCSRRLPEGTRRLTDMLREWLRDGRNNLFSGRIVSQDGQAHTAEDESLTPARVLAMNWLVDNVIGSIPDIESLRPEAQPLVRLQGLGVMERPDAGAFNWTDGSY